MITPMARAFNICSNPITRPLAAEPLCNTSTGAFPSSKRGSERRRGTTERQKEREERGSERQS